MNMAKETERQRLNDELVRREVLACQTGLVENILQAEPNPLDSSDLPTIDEIENMYQEICPECGEPLSYEGQGVCESCGKSMIDLDVEQEPKEIFEWWLVTEWFANKLREQNEPVLCHDQFNYWWGRTCTGQSICLDHVIDRIRESLK